jgi:hypothetical protein
MNFIILTKIYHSFIVGYGCNLRNPVLISNGETEINIKKQRKSVKNAKPSGYWAKYFMMKPLKEIKNS